jgi:hypothetical protein
VSSPDDERRYSDEEFALILKTASEEEAAQVAAAPQQGLTLAEIQEIATAVGIDAQSVARAAALVPSMHGDTANRLIGASPRQRLEHTISGVVQAEDLGSVVDVARRALDIQGETREVMGGLEWKGSSATTTVMVSISPGEDETRLQVSCDRTEALAGIYAGVGMAVAGAIALFLAKLVFGETDAGIVASILTGFPVALLAARAVWKRSAKKWRERLFGLMHVMSKEAETATFRALKEGEPE